MRSLRNRVISIPDLRRLDVVVVVGPEEEEARQSPALVSSCFVRALLVLNSQDRHPSEISSSVRISESSQPPSEDERSTFLLVGDGDDRLAFVGLEFEEVSNRRRRPEGLGPREVRSWGSVGKGERVCEGRQREALVRERKL